QRRAQLVTHRGEELALGLRRSLQGPVTLLDTQACLLLAGQKLDALSVCLVEVIDRRLQCPVRRGQLFRAFMHSDFHLVTCPGQRLFRSLALGGIADESMEVMSVPDSSRPGSKLHRELVAVAVQSAQIDPLVQCTTATRSQEVLETSLVRLAIPWRNDRISH